MCSVSHETIPKSLFGSRAIDDMLSMGFGKCYYARNNTQPIAYRILTQTGIIISMCFAKEITSPFFSGKTPSSMLELHDKRNQLNLLSYCIVYRLAQSTGIKSAITPHTHTHFSHCYTRFKLFKSASH